MRRCRDGRGAVGEDDVSALPRPKALGAFEHGGKDDHGQRYQLFIAAKTVIRKRIVLHLIAGTLVGEHVGSDIMRGIHHPHNGDVDIEPVV